MGNRVVIGILVIIALILTGAGFTWFKNNSDQKTSTQAAASPSASQSPAIQASVSSDTRVTLKDLFASSKSQKCSFTDSSSGSTGMIYTSNGKMRGDFTSKSNGQMATSHMIVENQVSYVWTDASTQGVKMSYEKVAQLTSATASAQASVTTMPISLDQKVSYQCEAWVADPAILTLPTTVKFNDFSSLIPQIKASASGSATTDTKSAACSACDQLSGAPRDQCRKALAC